MILFAVLFADQIFQYFLTHGDIAAVGLAVEVRRVEMHRTQICWLGQNIMEILFSIMAQLLLRELAFCPGYIERMLEQMSRINDGIDLLLKRYISFHGFPLERDGGRSTYHLQIMALSQICKKELQEITPARAVYSCLRRSRSYKR